ncbi:hypothetical protein ACIRBZ_11170 [Streptomyces sp. NPDC094038]|uniref:hypothetical protein n=1 Tax=Streptomyces sp. NPDC094038 TaxID=3366055 RepID=UPI0037FF0CBB
MAAAGNPEATPEPLIGADGRITLVWNVWLPTWTTNTAVASWTLTVTDPVGRTVRTLTGAPAPPPSRPCGTAVPALARSPPTGGRPGP